MKIWSRSVIIRVGCSAPEHLCGATTEAQARFKIEHGNAGEDVVGLDVDTPAGWQRVGRTAGTTAALYCPRCKTSEG